MAINVFKGTAESISGLKVKCSSGNHEFILDEPEDLGGTDEGMNPIEATLCALGACKCIVAQCFAKAKGVDLKSLRVEVEGDLDPDGFMGKNPDAKIGLQNVRSNYYIESDSPEEKIRDFVKFIDKTCPVADSLDDGPNMISDIKIN